MGVNRVVSTEYRNKLINGDDYSLNPAEFATNLVGSAMTAVQCTINIVISWGSKAESFQPWNLSLTNLTRSAGSFFDDGWFAGQEFAYLNNAGVQEFTGAIDGISQDGTVILFTVLTGVVSPANDIEDTSIRAFGNVPANQFQGLFYRFGLPTNNESFTFNSRISNTAQRYEQSNVTGALQSMNAQGTLKDFVTGQSQCRLVSTDTYTQTYQVLHEFVIAPWALEDQVNNIQELRPPSYFLGDECLRHCFEVELRPTASQPNGAVTAQVDSIIGFTGWFNESGNGLPSKYTLESIVYEDSIDAIAVEGLQNTRNTKATITLSGSFTPSDRVGVLHSIIPDSSFYAGVTTDAIANFVYDSLYAPIDGGLINGSGVIKSLEANILGGDLVLGVEVEYTSSQGQYIEPFNYVLAVHVANNSLGVTNTDQVALKADIRDYITPADNLSGLMSIKDHRIVFGNSGVLGATSDFVGYNADSLNVQFDFTLDTFKKARLQSLVFRLIADNQSESKQFELDRYEFDLAGIVDNGTSQLIDLATTRAYPYPSGNVYDEVTLKSGALIGVNQEYSLTIGQKIRWEDWLSNQNADGIFFDSTKPNKNLNFKSSNYSLLNGYSIRAELSATLTGVDDIGIDRQVDYAFISPILNILDYGVEQNFSAVVEFFDESGIENLGNQFLLNATSLVRATFTPIGGTAIDLNEAWAAIRIQQIGNAGQQIAELAIDYSTNEDSPLQPKQGESFLTISEQANTVVCECLVDGNRLVSGNYIVIPRYSQSIGFVFEFVTTAQEVEFLMGGSIGLDVTMFLPDGTQINVPENVFFSYDFGTAEVRRIGFTVNDASLWQEIKISRSDQSGNSIIGALDFSKLTALTTVEAQSNQIDNVMFGSFIQAGGVQVELHNNDLDVTNTISQIGIDNADVNAPSRLITLFDNDGATLEDVASIQAIESLGLNLIIPLWGLTNN